MGDYYDYYGTLKFKPGTPPEICAELEEDLDRLSEWPDEVRLYGDDEIDISGTYKYGGADDAIEQYGNYLEDSDTISVDGPGGFSFQRIRNGKWEYGSAVPSWEVKDLKYHNGHLCETIDMLTDALHQYRSSVIDICNLTLRELKVIERLYPKLLDTELKLALEKALKDATENDQARDL